MKKYKILVYTSNNNFLPACVMDEEQVESLREQLFDDDSDFLHIEDDTEEDQFYIQKSHIVGIDISEYIPTMRKVKKHEKN
jgi:hypothetical protein